MSFRNVDPKRLADLRGKRSREVIAHGLRSRGYATDAKTIWRWETGKNVPNARVLADYAQVLGVDSVDELYADPDDAEAALMAPLAADNEFAALFDAMLDSALARRATKERVA